MQGVSYRELQEDSEGNHSLGPFEQHSDFFEPRSDLDLNTNSMACGLDMMAQQEVNGVSEPMTEDSSFNLLQGFPQIGEMGRQVGLGSGDRALPKRTSLLHSHA